MVFVGGGEKNRIFLGEIKGKFTAHLGGGGDKILREFKNLQ